MQAPDPLRTGSNVGNWKNTTGRSDGIVGYFFTSMDSTPANRLSAIVRDWVPAGDAFESAAKDAVGSFVSVTFELFEGILSEATDALKLALMDFPPVYEEILDERLIVML
jgi:hypothetical protein